MPKVFVHENGVDYWKLVNPTDEELKEQLIGRSFSEPTEEQIEAYIKDIREKEAEVLRKQTIAAQKAREEREKYEAEHPKEVTEVTEVKVASLFSSPKPIPKDKNSDKRLKYSREIGERENEMDDLRHLETNFQARNEKFMSSAAQHFEASEELFYQRGKYPSNQSQWQQNVVQDTYAHMKAIAQQQGETLENSCRTTRIAIEDEIEGLYKERNALPW